MTPKLLCEEDREEKRDCDDFQDGDIPHPGRRLIVVRREAIQ